MKQNIYIAALLAGMLALAGCGGGSSSDGDPPLRTYTQAELDAEVNTKSKAARKASCTGTGLTYDESSKMCKVDSSMADARTKYLALYSALNAFNFTKASLHASNADDKDNSDKAMLSKQGEKFSELNDVADGVITLSGNIPKGNVVFDGVAAIGQKIHKKETPYDSSNDGTNDAFRFAIAGSYRDIRGMYFCTGGTSCTSTISSTGKDVTLAGGSWTFEANDKNQRVMDSDVVVYGWWTDTPSSGSLQAGLFSSRNMAAQSSGDNGTTGFTGGGSATYNGDALGQYAIDKNNYGAFTAMTTLTANFGMVDTLEGMIHDFKDADDENLTGWEVKLHKSQISPSGATEIINGDANSLQARWHIGNDKGSAGKWQAGLYGAAGADTAPTHVAGEFFAHGPTSERIIGAFAAE